MILIIVIQMSIFLTIRFGMRRKSTIFCTTSVTLNAQHIRSPHKEEEIDSKFLKLISMEVGEVACKSGRSDIVKMANHFHQLAIEKLNEIKPAWR